MFDELCNFFFLKLLLNVCVEIQIIREINNKHSRPIYKIDKNIYILFIQKRKKETNRIFVKL